MKKKIIVPIEFNQLTPLQVDGAIDYAERFDRDIIFLLVFETDSIPTIVSGFESLSEKEKEAHHDLLIIRKIIAHYSQFNGKTELMIMKGRLDECLNLLNREGNSQTIIFNPGTTKFQHKLFSDKVIAVNQYPNLKSFIPAQSKPQIEHNRILYISGTKKEDLNNLNWLTMLVEKADLSIEVLVVQKKKSLLNTFRFKKFVNRTNRIVSQNPNITISKSPFYLNQSDRSTNRISGAPKDIVAFNLADSAIREEAINTPALNRLLHNPNHAIIAL